ncbi:hypothetical protein LguiA_004730 [Lonicera macranthoides]
MELRFFNSLTNCKNLEVLEISLYQFNGILPASIANLSTSFRVFEAFGCQIKGELPIGIGNLSGLTTLLLDSNELTGFIPLTLERLENPALLVLYIELLQATNGFTENNLLGVRGGGSVYKGMLDAVNVVVKVSNLQSEEEFKSFDIECEFLRNIRHRNLTKIVSSCSNSDFLALVLQYLSNGGLEKWLYSHNYCLTILERLDIMINVASGLEYLHHGQRTPIIHWDLKRNNILLDKDMITHVCDFGIAKLLGEEEFMAQTKTLATIGYMAPSKLPSLLLQLLL